VSKRRLEDASAERALGLPVIRPQAIIRWAHWLMLLYVVTGGLFVLHVPVWVVAFALCMASQLIVAIAIGYGAAQERRVEGRQLGMD
jgi:hypothetical protein